MSDTIIKVLLWVPMAVLWWALSIFFLAHLVIGIRNAWDQWKGGW